MVEITKKHLNSFLYMTVVVIVAGCVVFYLLSNAAAGSIPIWLLGGVLSWAFYLVGYLVRWITATKKAT